jgi:periplasmic copper chaperone A
MTLRLFAIATTLAATITAAPAQTGQIEITNAWARATPGGATTGAAYLTIVSPAADRLVAASSPVAKSAQLHTMTMQGNIMKMRQVAGIDLPAGKPVTLKPGGLHIMLVGLNAPLAAGQNFPLTLTFRNAGSKEVTVAVAKVGAMAPSAGKGGMGGMSMPMQH